MSVEIICILDRSYSMSGSEGEVLGSFNHFIKEQKEIKGKAFVTLILFDDKYEVVLNRTKITKTKKLTNKDYYVRGCTALYDAIGKTINNVDSSKTKVIVLIQTDGMENASNDYTKESIKSLIQEKEGLGWTFKFIGSDLSQTATQSIATSIGIKIGDTIRFDKSDLGFRQYTSFLSSSTTAYRAPNLEDTAR